MVVCWPDSWRKKTTWGVFIGVCGVCVWGCVVWGVGVFIGGSGVIFLDIGFHTLEWEV